MKRAGKTILKTMLVLVGLLQSYILAAQMTGMIKGTITEKGTNDPLPFANVKLELKDTVLITVSDFDGQYAFRKVPEGKYEVTVSYVGYQEQIIQQVGVSAQKITFLDFIMDPTGIALESVEIVEWAEPLIKQDNCTMATKISRTTFERMPVISVSEAATRSNSMYEEKYRGNMLRGSRGTVNQTFIDGVKVKEKDKNKPYQYSRKERQTEEYSKYVEQGFQISKMEPLSTFSLDVDVASYCIARKSINDGSLPYQEAIRIEELINYFPYRFDLPKGNEPFSIKTEYGPCAWNPEHKLLMLGIKGKELNPEEVQVNNLVFLIDVSGSMNTPDKLPLLKRSMHLLVDQLSEKDKIGIVVYAGRAEIILNPSGVKEKDQIHEAIESLNADGSTAGGEGLQWAYDMARLNYMKNGNNRIILATDGDFNVGVSSEDGLRKLIEEKRQLGIYLSVLGFGTANIKDNKMEALADCGNGNYAYIDNLLEAKKVLVNELHSTLVTVANDVKFQVEFNPNRVKGYRLIGYETRRLENEDFNNDKKDAGELGAGKTVVALYEIIPTGVKGDADLPDIDDLKYQRTVAENSDELLTLKMRYKLHGEDQSLKTTYPVMDKPADFAQTSDDFRFASAVSQYGMCLRNSAYKGEASLSSALELARNARGSDEDGYRAEFVRLVSMAETLAK